MMSPLEPLPLIYGAETARDIELAGDLYDATTILAMGDSGISAQVADGLRRRRLEAARELLRRWQAEP